MMKLRRKSWKSSTQRAKWCSLQGIGVSIDRIGQNGGKSLTGCGSRICSVAGVSNAIVDNRVAAEAILTSHVVFGEAA